MSLAIWILAIRSQRRTSPVRLTGPVSPFRGRPGVPPTPGHLPAYRYPSPDTPAFLCLSATHVKPGAVRSCNSGLGSPGGAVP